MAGAERAGEPHGRRRSAGRGQRAVPDGHGRLSAEGRASTGDSGGRAGHVVAPTPSRELDGGTRAGARVTGADTSGEDRPGTLRAVTTYMRANPQVFALLVICLVLGLGTFLAVVIGLLTAGSGQTTGEPSGAILGVRLLAPATRWLMP